MILPHVGSATNKTRGAMGDLQVENLGLHFAGKPVLTRVGRAPAPAAIPLGGAAASGPLAKGSRVIRSGFREEKRKNAIVAAAMTSSAASAKKLNLGT